MTAKVLVTGAAGQLGRALLAASWPEGLAPIALSRAALDITDASSIARHLDQQRPSAVINAAAFTAVDQAEQEQALALQINSTAVKQLAEATAARGIALLHFSTDYVFDGTKAAPYVEDDRPAPLNAYGASKLAGEAALRQSNPRHVILRTGWVYAPWGKNFLLTIRRLAAEQPELRVVSDQRGAPTSALDIAAAAVALCQGLVAQAVAPGTYHFAAGGATTWYDFAQVIVARAHLGSRVVPISSHAYGAPARRPANSCLNCGKITEALGVAPRPWQVMLDEVLALLV